jgi:hypothetical protein
VTPADLLAAARDVLNRPAPATIGGWPRAVALLTRQALEKAVAEYWKVSPTTAGLGSCPMRTQLTCLPTYLDHRLAHDVNYVWAALSSACHYHPYDLAPTAAELSGWIDSVTALLATIGDMAADTTQPASDGRAPVTGHVG